MIYLVSFGYNISENDYNRLTFREPKLLSFPAYKYFYLLNKGFYQNLSITKGKIINLSIPAFSYAKNLYEIGAKKKIRFYKKNHLVINLYGKKMSRLIYFFKIYFLLIKISSRKSSKIYFLFDGLNLLGNLLSFIFLFYINIITISLITDFPQYVGDIYNKKLVNRIYDSFVYLSMRFSKKYILLTDAMKKKTIFFKQKYVIIEGFSKFTKYRTRKKQRIVKNYVLYSGSIHKKFGIEKLIKCFETLDIPLVIVGDGDYKSILIEKIKNSSNIKFLGYLNNKKVTNLQNKATLLVNPRPTNLSLSLYSFPSKLIEYLEANKLVLTTRLPGIGREYYNNLFFFEKEDIESMTSRIKEVFELGLKSTIITNREFVIKSKNYIIQTKKILKIL